jgi:hypothetical protein
MVCTACLTWEFNTAPWQPFVAADPPDMGTNLGRLVGAEIYINNKYQVNVSEEAAEGLGSVHHLSIKRLDKEAIHDWRHMQRIKNEICHPDRQAVEIYPPEQLLVDTSNQYHLWVLPAGILLPFGIFDGRLVAENSSGGAVQRPFEQKPEGLVEIDVDHEADAITIKEPKP